VIVNKNGVNISTFVSHDNVVDLLISEPTTYAQAIVQQHPEVEKLFKALAKQLGKFDIGLGNRAKGVHEILDEYINKAVESQLLLGHRAEYKRVSYRNS
jgi:hypothetical protein